MEFVLYGLVGLILLIALLSAMAPTRVSYTEEITINASVAQVHDDIRLQEHLMRWSAWPQETKSTCTVEGPDGQIGAKTAFFTKGKRVGYQEVVSLKKDQEVALVPFGPGPPHRPRLTFELRAIDANQTKVIMHFVNKLPRPFNAIWRFAGLTKWTRGMHLKDLKGLKAFAEPPHLDMTGRPVGRPQSGANPFEHRGQAA